MKVFGTQSYNLHSLSLHHSQKEQNCLKKNKAFILPLSTMKGKEGKKREKETGKVFNCEVAKRTERKCSAEPRRMKLGLDSVGSPEQVTLLIPHWGDTCFPSPLPKQTCGKPGPTSGNRETGNDCWEQHRCRNSCSTSHPSCQGLQRCAAKATTPSASKYQPASSPKVLA